MPAGQNQWGSIRWGASAATPGSGLALDVANANNDLWYRLGFASAGEIVSTSWVTAAELFGWADEAVRRLAYVAGVFATLDTSITVVAGTAVYAQPAGLVFSLAAWLDGAPLRITPQAQLESLESAWVTTSGPATRVSYDAREVGQLVLYPNPDAGGLLAQVAQMAPGTVSQAASTLPLPAVLQDYFSYAMLGQARFKESESRMAEIAEHCQERCKIYESIMVGLWGSA